MHSFFFICLFSFLRQSLLCYSLPLSLLFAATIFAIRCHSLCYSLPLFLLFAATLFAIRYHSFCYLLVLKYNYVLSFTNYIATWGVIILSASLHGIFSTVTGFSFLGYSFSLLPLLPLFCYSRLQSFYSLPPLFCYSRPLLFLFV